MKAVLACYKYGVPLSDPCCYPLGFMYVSSMLKKMGHKVKVLNYNLKEHDFEKEITGNDAVMFSGFEEFLPLIERDTRICREKGIKTVLGGALATFRTSEMEKIVDSVVVGPGFVDIPTAPYPDYEGFGIDEYHRRHEVRYMGVLTAAGCPFSCNFCSHIGPYQERQLEDVFDEIDFYHAKWKIELIIVNDNTLNVHKHRFMEFCEGMKGRDIAWTAAIRSDRFDEEMCRAAKDSGVNYLLVGIESFMQERLNKMGKRTKVADNLRTLDLLEKYKIRYHGNLLLGFDWDSPDSLHKELASMQMGYNVFPVLYQPFIGAKAKSGISGTERERLSSMFKDYAEGKGMNVYQSKAA